jgi:DNA-binding response OmpR family regulator
MQTNAVPMDTQASMQIRVLITEPDRPLLETYERFLTQRGFQLLTATNGPDCVTALRQHRPDVLLLEPDLPDDWGQRLLQMMQEGQIPAVPVVVLSRRDDHVNSPSVRESFNKPTSLSVIAAKIRQIVVENGSSGAQRKD